MVIITFQNSLSTCREFLILLPVNLHNMKLLSEGVVGLLSAGN